MKTKHWVVVSPLLRRVEVICPDIGGPESWEPDIVEVEAPTRRDAIRAGVALMKDWPQEARSDGRNPYAGISAYEAERREEQ